MKPFVLKSARDSAFVFLGDERVRLTLLLDAIEHMGYSRLMRDTRLKVEARLKLLTPPSA